MRHIPDYFLKFTGITIFMATGFPSFSAGDQSGDEEIALTASSISFWSGPLNAFAFMTLPVSETVNDTETRPSADVPSGYLMFACTHFWKSASEPPLNEGARLKTASEDSSVVIQTVPSSAIVPFGLAGRAAISSLSAFLPFMYMAWYHHFRRVWWQ